ncbi:MAG: M28 family metallopeptidase [Firmicutes bacterium]|nr:M28 family metallopeptidase [Bacillota bacterium]
MRPAENRHAPLAVYALLGLWMAIGSLARPVAQQPAPPAPVLRGFSASRAAAQSALEQRLQRLPDPARIERHLQALTAVPHMAGTPASRRVAEYIHDALRSYGWQAELVGYRAWLPQPIEVHLELVAPRSVLLARPEDPIEEEAASYAADVVAGFNAYSPSAEVEAEVVYVNYGLPDDYARLCQLGVAVEGRVVLARYGHSFRGVKVRLAEENGAAGLILYSDPADDGYVAGDVYPRGPYRPNSGIQRGSILYIFRYPGDPLTPGIPATEQAPRLAPAAAASLPRVPTLPVAARDAADILAHLGGPRVPREWQGGLPLTYHLGPGPATVRMRLRMDEQQRDVWNVVARLPGERDDEWVLAGNHHDAWAFGAVDPSSGTAVLLELARVLGQLAREGWQPRRTLLFGFWDAEEYGLIGSVEWVEQHRAELAQKAVAYVNLDSAVSGTRFGAGGTPSLRALLREATDAVTDPRTGRSLHEVWQQQSSREPVSAGADANLPVGLLGSGSDYTPFVHHAGVAALDLGFSGEYGVYHSRYDNFQWMRRYGDPEFAYHAALVRLAGVVLLRLSQADLLPFDFLTYAAEVQKAVGALQALVRQRHAPLDLAPVASAAAGFADAAARAEQVLRAAAADAGRSAAINRRLRSIEQALLHPEGLTGRPWYRHTVFAPGTDTGYAAVLLPGVREAIERHDWATARREAAALAAALERAAARLEEVARLAAPEPPAAPVPVGAGAARR